MDRITKFWKKKYSGRRTMGGRRILAPVLAGTLLAGLVVPVSAASQEPNTEKQEVVYANLNADGSVSGIYVVNIFDLDGEGQIIDYGDYQLVRNMTTTDEIQYADGTVSIEAGEGKLYYEGKLDSSVIPWNISIHYYMDGEEYSADEIAGMSGAFKMTIDITENTSCAGGFFDGCALQATVTLDTDLCRNISAPDATMANAGRDKQLTYTILPGEGAGLTITADVTDFEMDAISINGVPLNLNIEIDDGELMDRIAELQDAIEELDDGAGELCDGVSELADGARTELADGASALADGADELYGGTSDLKEGGGSLESGAADLESGADELDGGAWALNAGVEQIRTALDTLNAQSETLTDGSSEFKAALKQIRSALDNVSVSSDDITALTAASSSIKSGIDDLVNGVGELRQNVSFAAYKAVMSQNGLDIDELQATNTGAIASINDMLEKLSAMTPLLTAMGISQDTISEYTDLADQLILLLQANNANIAGTESYLTTVNQSLSALLAGAEDLQTNYAAFDFAVGELADTLHNLIYQTSALASAVDALAAAYGELDDGVTEYTDAVARIAAGYQQISDGASQLAAGSGSLVSASGSLHDGTSELLAGIVGLYDGAGELKDGADELDDGVQELLTGIAELRDGAGELKDGASALEEETGGMDAQISDRIDKLLESITGEDVKTVSFVSEKNTNIDSVQFVIKTPAVEIAQGEEAEAESSVPLNFWQKLLRLFGLY